jgi:hypothetical protein
MGDVGGERPFSPPILKLNWHQAKSYHHEYLATANKPTYETDQPASAAASPDGTAQ